MDRRPWITFFSQTGAEIADISEAIGRWPDRIITNDRPEHLRTIDPRIQKQGYFTFNNKPDVEEYMELLEQFPDAIVTLHGWLRVIPGYICERSRIYNGHPGLITDYPELKGKDPQVRAFEGKYEQAGSVLHRVIPEVDEGEIIDESRFAAEGFSLDELFRILKGVSLDMWVKFLKEAL